MVKNILVLTLSLGLWGYGALKTSVDLRLYNIISKNDKDWSYTPLGEGLLYFSSVGDSKVRAQLSIKLRFSTQEALVDIYRAYVKFRLLKMSMTMGKSALSWGDGYYYNSGDIVFLNQSENDIFSTEDIRDNSRWLIRMEVPMGLFSFWEWMVIGPSFSLFETRLNEKLGVMNGNTPNGEETSFGTRFFFPIESVQTQIGYLYTIKEHKQTPYISFQGSFGEHVNFSLASSIGIESENFSEEKLKDEWQISFGLYYPIKASDHLLINLRLETLFIPLAKWLEQDNNINNVIYGNELFLEMGFVIYSIYNLIFRNITSPIDKSSQFVLVSSMNFFKGFSLVIQNAYQVGEGKDRFGWNKPGGFLISLGVTYVY